MDFNPLSINEIDIPFIVISIAYGMFPILYNTFGLFKKHAEHMTREYRTVTNILRIEIPLLAILALYYSLFKLSGIEPFYSIGSAIGESQYSSVGHFSTNLMYFILYSAFGGLLWIAFSKITNKDFYFYLAKGCFENIFEKNDIGKMESMREV